MAPQIPYEKLRFFRERLGFGPGDREHLQAFKGLFSANKDRFADFFHDVFFRLDETRLIIEHTSSSEVLRRAWASWFEALFTSPLSEDLLGYIWNIGVRHVEVALDQRYSNLGFALARQFCQRMIMEEVPAENRAPLLIAVDKLLDLSVLIETSAYIEKTTRCDLEVMREMADRVRNPVTVIGGNLRRLQRRAGEGSVDYSLYERLLGESERIDAMVRDIKIYMDTFDKEFRIETVDIASVIEEVLSALRDDPRTGGLAIETDVAGFVTGDRQTLSLMFRYLLENSLEAAGKGGRIRVRKAREEGGGPDLTVEIVNTGELPEMEDHERLFSPFFTSKQGGTGFGLPIARLIAHKHFGRIAIVAMAGGGTRVSVTLPRAG